MFDKQVKVLWTARYDYKPGWKLNLHKHDYYQLIYFVKGQGEFLLDDEKYSIEDNSIFIINPGQEHGFESDSKNNIKTLDIKFLIYEKEISQQMKELSSKRYTDIPEIKNLLESIRKEGVKKDPRYKEFSSVFLMEILLILIRYETQKITHEEVHRNKEIGKSTIVKDVIEYINNNYMNQLTLDCIAESLNYNKSYICQLFNSEMDYTPMQYIHKCRIKKACELILYSDYSLKEIAEVIGFKTVHHFNRVFSRIKGIPPGQWRDEEREGIWKDIYFDEQFNNQSYIDR